jgi:uncharacterized protein
VKPWWCSLLLATFAACHAPPSRNTAPARPVLAPTSSAPPVRLAPAQPQPESPLPAGEARITAPLLFALTRDGRTSYLLGTLHLGVDAKHQLPTWVWDYFTAATTFAMEADPNDPALQQAMFRSDGSTLRDELGDTAWQQMATALGESAAEALNDLTVPMATSAIALTGLPATQPMDAAFAEAASAQQKPVVFLESIAVQIQFGRKWLDSAALTSMLDDFAMVPQRNRELLAAYRQGELAGLTRVVRDGRRDFLRTGRPGGQYDAMMTELLSQRNRMWVPVVEQLHGAGPTFIAVGALHLAGPDGLIDLLHRRGFVVTQLKQP